MDNLGEVVRAHRVSNDTGIDVTTVLLRLILGWRWSLPFMLDSVFKLALIDCVETKVTMFVVYKVNVAHCARR